MSNLLADASFLIALANPKDKFHQRAKAFSIKSHDTQIIPQVALTEASHIIEAAISHRAMMTFIRTVAESSVRLESINHTNLLRAYEIMTTYPEARFDFVDACIMALAEHLNITRICTFDRRDFAIFRPTHGVALELLP